MMKIKSLFSIAAFLLYSSILFAEPYSDVKNSIEFAAGDPLKTMAKKLAPVMGFYTGSGNMLGMNIATSPSLKIGLGVGGAVNTTLFSKMTAFDSLGSLSFSDSASISNSSESIKDILAYVPMPYYMVYGKMGIPSMPADAGLRLGFIPPLSFTKLDTTVKVSEFHAGGEFRYNLMESSDGTFRLDSRASLDYAAGAFDITSDVDKAIIINGTNVGNNNIKMNINYGWGGVSIGGKLQGGIYNKSVGGLYLGLGANCNLGSVKAALNSDVTYTPSVIGIYDQHDTISASYTQAYDPFDFRVYMGGQLFFMQLAVEYGLLSGFLAATFYPVALEF